ncbi:hypothetical protein PsYK624_077430 [Phanerochaete sordida]|uniref:Uncharacterized protein n=1 Tax=Phanerochaete sordida TaxID=48140 RepID=A0A9P3G909_9APHY|nr:hypothetical protein PsYK624_077430 [Phanerochaete sordida]
MIVSWGPRLSFPRQPRPPRSPCWPARSVSRPREPAAGSVLAREPHGLTPVAGGHTGAAAAAHRVLACPGAGAIAYAAVVLASLSARGQLGSRQACVVPQGRRRLCIHVLARCVTGRVFSAGLSLLWDVVQHRCSTSFRGLAELPQVTAGRSRRAHTIYAATCMFARRARIRRRPLEDGEPKRHILIPPRRPDRAAAPKRHRARAGRAACVCARARSTPAGCGRGARPPLLGTAWLANHRRAIARAPVPLRRIRQRRPGRAAPPWGAGRARPRAVSRPRLGDHSLHLCVLGGRPATTRSVFSGDVTSAAAARC